jgi:PPK2 family polyphosphate:nucleotide phosphotransferase
MNHEDLRIRPGQTVRLAAIDPGFTCEFKGRPDARNKLGRDIQRLAELQEVFAAARSKALLIVLQGMDASGKDGAIKHVMAGINPQGVAVFSFKVPSEDELGHDYLWRYEKALPARGRIAIFNRSYYEEVAVIRVHQDLLRSEGMLAHSCDRRVWKERFEDINAFERHLVRNGTEIVKFFLHISKKEQRRRLLERLDDPEKNWKFSSNDVKERRYWERYLRAYERMLNNTSAELAPWYVIPSDHKWFMRAAIADVLVAKLEGLHLRYPSLDEAMQAILGEVRNELSL